MSAQGCDKGPVVPSAALLGAYGFLRGQLCWLILLWGCWHCGGRRVMSLFWACSIMDGACCLPMLGGEVPEGGVVDSAALWTLAATRSSSWQAGGACQQGHQQLLDSLCSRWAAYLFNLAVSLSFHSAHK